MPRLSLLPVMLREIFGEREFPREPEPDLVMDDPEQVKAYSEAGRADGLMAAAYLFHTAQISATISGCRDVIDLGCGPATQLAQVARLHPEIAFLGVDLSSNMLGDAESHVRSLALDNVRFKLGDITRLDLPDQSADAVISTLVLHHLPSHDHLLACFREVARVLRPGGALYLADFGRLKSLKSVLFFAYMNAKHQPHIFSLDYERSLRAAFELEDFRRAARAALPPQAAVFSTFKVPLLVLTKTGPRGLDPTRREEIRAMRTRLPARYRSDLDELRFFFRLGGLDLDPFRD